MNTTDSNIYKIISINNKNIFIVPHSYLFEKTFNLSFEIENKDLLKWISHKFSENMPFSNADFIYSYKLSSLKNDNSKDCLVYAILKNNFKKLTLSGEINGEIADFYIPIPFINENFDKKSNILYLTYYAGEILVVKYSENEISASRSLKIQGKNKSDINLFLEETKKYFEIKFSESLNISSELHCIGTDENNDLTMFNDMNIKIIQNCELNFNTENSFVLNQMEDFSKRRIHTYKRLRYILITFLILSFFILLTNNYILSLKNKYNVISEKIEKLEKEKRKNLNIFNKKKFVKFSSLSVDILLHSINVLYKTIPLNTNLYQFLIRKNGDFVIRGTSKSPIVTFVQELEKSEFFKNVSIKDLSRKEKTGEIEFQIIGIVNLWENKL